MEHAREFAGQVQDGHGSGIPNFAMRREPNAYAPIDPPRQQFHEYQQHYYPNSHQVVVPVPSWPTPVEPPIYVAHPATPQDIYRAHPTPHSMVMKPAPLDLSCVNRDCPGGRQLLSATSDSSSMLHHSIPIVPSSPPYLDSSSPHSASHHPNFADHQSYTSIDNAQYRQDDSYDDFMDNLMVSYPPLGPDDRSYETHSSDQHDEDGTQLSIASPSSYQSEGYQTMASRLQPYPCGGLCGVEGCFKRYANKAALKAHTVPRKRLCPVCQKEMLSRNLRRHQKRLHEGDLS